MDYYVKTIKSLKDYSKYDTCISTCLFKIRFPYNEFSYYVYKLKTWMKKIPFSSYIRIYVDGSVLEDKSFLSLYDDDKSRIEIVLFDFKDFGMLSPKSDFLIQSTPADNNIIEEEDSSNMIYHHDGTFGTMSRFLALYNKPELPKNIKYVWVTDTDMPSYIFSYNNILDLKKYKSQVSYYSKACYDREWIPSDIHYSIGAGKLISSTKVKYDFSHFERFLFDVYENKYADIKNRIIERRKSSKTHRVIGVKYFPYGFDELFANLYLIKDIEKYTYIVYYEISLEHFDKYTSLLSEKEREEYLKSDVYKNLTKAETKAWSSNSDNERLKTKRELIKYNEQMYKYAKNIPLENQRMQLCRSDFFELKNKVSFDTKTSWGLSSIVVKKP
jgi:hypothetical protein